MKKILNKFSVAILFVMANCSVALASVQDQIQTSLVQNGYYVNQSARTVVLVPTLNLRVSAVEVRADVNHWALLNVNINGYAGTDEQRSLQLQRQYPGYQIRWPVVSPSGDLILRSDVLQLNINLNAMPGAAGIAVSKQILITQRQYNALRNAEDSQELFRIEGSMTAAIPGGSVQEEYTLSSAEICNQLIENGRSVFSIMNAYSRIVSQIDGIRSIRSTTKESLKRSVLETCLNVDSVNVQSVSDLLDTELQRRSNSGAIVGLTLQSGPSNYTLPVRYVVSVQ